MKIGTFLSLIDLAIDEGEAKSITEAITPMTEKGLSFVDMDSHLLDEKYKLKPLFEELKSCGVSVGSMFHLMEFNHRDARFLENAREDTKLRIEQCAEFESPLFMPVPVVRYEHPDDNARCECRKVVAEYIAYVTEKAKEYGITTIVENYSNTMSPFSTLEDIDYLLKNINDLYYALDTGNFWFGGADVLDACELFGDKTRHVHLKDIFGKTDGAFNICGRSGDCVPIGAGEIPFKEIFGKMATKRYNEGWTIEICDHGNLISKVLRSIDFIHDNI